MNDKWTAYPVGTSVRCRNPDDFFAHVASKLRGRVGVVKKHQAFSGNPIVTFAPVGRRKEFTWVVGDPNWIEHA